MNKKKSIPYEINLMPDFMVDQLAAGILPSFLPVSFVYDQKSCMGVYDTEHYCPLSSIKEMPVKEVLHMFCRLLEMIAENEKHYVFGETYQISRQTIYVDRMRMQIKLIFSPLERLSTTKEQLCQLLISCEEMVSEEGRSYLADMAAYLCREDVGYFSAIHHGEQLQNEIYICDIN